ncbi:MAG: hypothetical protein BWX84_02964 [Verrucomicrobia bacterium ADurb.Bin118]|nr:MAG: hypothetical protein BWX84_02964 [Verrucomicrobia bacterium ADurb.Bin118]
MRAFLFYKRAKQIMALLICQSQLLYSHTEGR